MFTIDYPVKTENGILINTFATDVDFNIEGIREDLEVKKIQRVANNLLTITTVLNLGGTNNIVLGDFVELITENYNGKYEYVGGDTATTFNVKYTSNQFKGNEGDGTTKIGYCQYLQDWKVEILPIYKDDILRPIIEIPLVGSSINNVWKISIKSIADLNKIFKIDNHQDVQSIKILLRERHLYESSDISALEIWQDKDNIEFRLNDVLFTNPITVGGDIIYIINSSQNHYLISKKYNAFLSDFEIPSFVVGYKNIVSFLMNYENAKTDLDEQATIVDFSAIGLDINKENGISLVVPDNWKGIEIVTGIYNLDLTDINIGNSKYLDIQIALKIGVSEYDANDYDANDYLT